MQQHDLARPNPFPHVKITTVNIQQKRRGRPPKVSTNPEPEDEHTLFAEPKVLLVTPKVAGRMLAISENAVYRLIATKQLLSVKFGNCRRIPYSALEAFVDQLVEQSA
jgi:excisionase family DNA binding protein